MTPPREASRKLMREYFSARGEETPENDAQCLIDSVRVGAKPELTNRQIDFASSILTRARFDVDDVAENHLGVRIVIQRLAHLDDEAGAKVLGFARLLESEITICARAEGYEPLYRTTVMHELAHIILHRPVYRCPVNYAPNSSRRPPYEQEADLFMVDSLLPDAVLYTAILLYARVRATDFQSVLGIANTQKGRWEWRRTLLPFLINHLCLSRHLILIKLKCLGLITEQNVREHLRYRLETWWHKPESANHQLARSMRRIVGRANASPSMVSVV